MAQLVVAETRKLKETGIGCVMSGQFILAKDGRVFYVGSSKGDKSPTIHAVNKNRSIGVGIARNDLANIGLAVGTVVRLTYAPYVGISCMLPGNIPVIRKEPNRGLKAA